MVIHRLPFVLLLLLVHASQQCSAQVQKLPPIEQGEAGLSEFEVGATVLSLADLEGMSLGANPAIAEARQRLDAAHGRWLQSGLGPNPTVGYTASEIGNEGRGGQQGAFVQRTFVRGGKLQLSRNVACHDIQRLRDRLQVTQQRVLTDVRQAYYSLLILQMRIEVLGKFMDSLDRGIAVSRRLLVARETGKTDVLLAEIEQSQTQALLSTLETQQQARWRAIAQLVGMPGLAGLQLSDDGVSRIPKVTWDEIVSRVLSETPELAANDSEIRQDSAALRRAHAEVIPDVTAQVSVQYDAATSYTVTGVQVGWPWPIRNRNQGNIREAYANLRASQHQRERVERRVSKDLAEEFGRLQNARILVQQYESSILDKAEEARTIALAAYAEGELTMADVLNAQRAAREANMTYLDARLQLRTSYERMLGYMLSDSLEADVAR